MHGKSEISIDALISGIEVPIAKYLRLSLMILNAMNRRARKFIVHSFCQTIVRHVMVNPEILATSRSEPIDRARIAMFRPR